MLSSDDELQRSATIVLWRSKDASSFSAQVEQLLASLAEPLRRSLHVYHRVVDLVRHSRVKDLALTTSRIGVILASTGGELIFANDLAENMLARGAGLRVVNGQLRTESIDETRELLAEIKRCALAQAPEADPQHYAPMSITRKHHSFPLTIIVRPGPGFRPLRSPMRQSAILVLRDPCEQSPWPAEALARLFKLSAAEARLASEVARGASLAEAAAHLGISRNTVRSQLQGIFQKTGINRQSELVRALLNSAATST